MTLRHLRLSGVRNLQDTEMTPDPSCNVITGVNAAGKTSVLEAIHVLGRARSFRTPRLDHVRRDGVAPLLVQGVVDDGRQHHRLGVGRDDGGMRVRVDGADARGLSELARLLPVQVINTESQRLLQNGPEARRSFMNWTVFHVEQGFPAVWRRFDRALKQRNAALREGNERLARSLEHELVQAGERVDALRRRVLERLEPLARLRLDAWLGEVDIEFRYRSGWARGKTLDGAMADQREMEATMGYTMVGPQRADLHVAADGMDARHRLSRGQQKVLVVALLLAQAELVESVDGPQPVLLVDDLAAELDRQFREAILAALLESAGQCFLTAVDATDLPINQGTVFHVEQGRVTEVI